MPNWCNNHDPQAETLIARIKKCAETHIEALQKNGKAGTTLAHKAESIIASLASGTAQHHMDAIGSFTKYVMEYVMVSNLD
jgi:hypothetical protein